MGGGGDLTNSTKSYSSDNVIIIIIVEHLTSGNRIPGSRSYSDLLDTLADSVCIHQLVFKRRRSERYRRLVIRHYRARVSISVFHFHFHFRFHFHLHFPLFHMPPELLCNSIARCACRKVYCCCSALLCLWMHDSSSIYSHGDITPSGRMPIP